MLEILIASILFFGGALAYASRRVETDTQLLERCAGTLLVLGLVLLGFAFPFSD